MIFTTKREDFSMIVTIHYIFEFLLFQAQARECLFEKLELQSREGRTIDISLDLAQEAAQVNCFYDNFDKSVINQ